MYRGNNNISITKNDHQASVRTHNPETNAFAINMHDLTDDLINPPVVEEEEPCTKREGKYELIKKKLKRRADGKYNFDSHKGFFATNAQNLNSGDFEGNFSAIHLSFL